MKPLQLKTNSWHYKAAEFGGNIRPHGHSVCSYTRSVLLGIFAYIIISIAIALLAVFVSYVISEIVMSIAFSVYMGINMFTEAGLVGSIAVSMLLFIYGVFYFEEKLSTFLSRKHHEKYFGSHNRELRPDGFIKSAYKAYKEKYCYPVEFD